MQTTHPQPTERGQLVFPSLESFNAAVAEHEAYLLRRSDHRWTGETAADAIAKTRTGDTARVTEAEAMIEKIQAEIELETTEWQHDVAGAFPDVPAFLAGQPDCMIRRVRSESEKSPVRVWLDVTSSAGINHTDLAKRGTAALALVMGLIREGRAVELYTYTSLGGNGKAGQAVVAVRMPTAPIDLAAVAYCMTSTAYSRTLNYGIAYKMADGNGTWSKHGNSNDSDLGRRISAHRDKVLAGLYSPGDVILPNPHLRDQVIKDPVQWVNDRLAEARGLDAA